MKRSPKANASSPTASELSILRILWTQGPSTVRQVQESLGGETGYTTALKLLQIMHDRGLVSRDETERTHVYAASQPAEHTQRHLVRQLIDRAFNGSLQDFVCQALSSKKASSKELEEIRRILAEMQKKEGTK